MRSTTSVVVFQREIGRDEAAGVFYYVMELADDAVSGTHIDPATYVPLTLRELRARRTVLPASHRSRDDRPQR